MESWENSLVDKELTANVRTWVQIFRIHINTESIWWPADNPVTWEVEIGDPQVKLAC